MKGKQMRTNRAKENSKTKELFKNFREYNNMEIFAKAMLSASIYRNAHVKSVVIVTESGVEIEFSSRDSSAFKKMVSKLRVKQLRGKK